MSGAPPRRPVVVGHRGAAARAPENTAAAVRIGLEAGADMIEIDVGVSRDGRVVLLHDLTLDRTTSGRGRLADWDRRELSELDAGSWFGPAFRGEPVPTLESILSLTRGRAPLIVEIKTTERGRARRIDDRPVVPAVIAELRASPAQTIVSSFDWPLLAEARAADPERPVALTVPSRRAARAIETAVRLGAAYVLVERTACSRQLVNRAHEHGMEVHAWVVNRAAEVPPLLRAGVDGMISDDPGWLVSALAPSQAATIPPDHLDRE